MTLLKNPSIEAKIDISSTLYNSQKIWLPIQFPSHFLFITLYNFSLPYCSFLNNINFSCMCKQSWGLEWSTTKPGKTRIASIISIIQSLVCYVHKIFKTFNLKIYVKSWSHYIPRWVLFLIPRFIPMMVGFRCLVGFKFRFKSKNQT